MEEAVKELSSFLMKVLKHEYRLNDLKELIETIAEGKRYLVGSRIWIEVDLMCLFNNFDNSLIQFNILNLSNNIVFMFFINSHDFFDEFFIISFEKRQPFL